MGLSVGAITLFVADLERSKEFYGRALAAEPLFEDETSAAFRLENTLVNLVVLSSADELIEPLRPAPEGTRSMLTIFVGDADAVVGELASRGVALLNGPVDRPWGVRTAAFADPDGHVWEIAQQLG